MEQKKNQKDVLIVRDEKTGEISVVAGLKKDGTPKTTAASGANQKDFLLFDKNSNPLDSFLDNFFRQCKEPKRFGFYRVAAEGVENVVAVMKDLLKDPVAFGMYLHRTRSIRPSTNRSLRSRRRKRRPNPKRRKNDRMRSIGLSTKRRSIAKRSSAFGA